VPYDPAPVELVLALGSIVAVSIGIGLASGWTLRPGDRCRQSVRRLGAAWRGMLSSDPGPSDATRTDAGLAAPIVVALLGLVLAMRGVSDRVTHTLQPLPYGGGATLLLLALWTLAVTLESQRLLGARRRRRTERVTSATRAALRDGAIEDRVAVIDLSPRGASVIAAARVDDGSSVTLALDDPAVEIRAVVRHGRRTSDGRMHYGLEFVDVPVATADALVRHTVVRDALLRLAAVAPPVDGRWEASAERPQAGVRIAAITAAAGAFASAGAAAHHLAPGHVAVMACAGVLALGVVGGSLGRREQTLRLVDAAPGREQDQLASPDFAMR
jgi:hypothetical protein